MHHCAVAGAARPPAPTEPPATRRIRIEAKWPDLVTPDGPTQRVGAPPREELDGVGRIMASAIVRWFDNGRNRELVKRLQDHGVDPGIGGRKAEEPIGESS